MDLEIDEVNISPLYGEKEYKEALAEINGLMDAEAGTEAFDRLDILATLVEAYEKKFHPITPPSPVEAIEFALDRLGKSLQEIAPLFGGLDQAEKVLRRRRRLTLPMIHRLSAALDIPVATLAQDYPLNKTTRRASPAAQKI